MPARDLQCFPDGCSPESIAYAEDGLLGAVGLDVRLGGMFRMIRCMNVMGMRQVRMMGGLLMVVRLVVPGSFVVMTRSVLVMLGCLFVMMGCFL